LAAKAMSMPYIDLPGAEYWVVEAYRIMEGSLDYERTISRELERLGAVRADFEKMDKTTY
ncbi:MAG: hypothetical protein WCL50_18890, partial [Spirochaetota bacterium]